MAISMQPETQENTRKKRSSKVSLFGDLAEYPSDPVEAAHTLYHLGFSVIPFNIYLANGKVHKVPTLTTWKPYRLSWEDVERKVKQTQAFGIVVPKGFMVVDLDCDNENVGAKYIGLDNLIDLSEKYSSSLDYLDTITCNTPTGGIHLWFRIPPGLVLKNSASTIADKIDLRASVDGLVLMPPSKSVHGNYSFDSHFEAQNGSRAPAWLIREITKAKKESSKRYQEIVKYEFDGSAKDVEKYLKTKTRMISTASEGNRNHTLNGVAYGIYSRVSEGKVPLGAADSYIYEAAMEAGLSHQEILATMGSAKRAQGV